MFPFYQHVDMGCNFVAKVKVLSSAFDYGPFPL